MFIRPIVEKKFKTVFGRRVGSVQNNTSLVSFRSRVVSGNKNIIPEKREKLLHIMLYFSLVSTFEHNINICQVNYISYQKMYFTHLDPFSRQLQTEFKKKIILVSWEHFCLQIVGLVAWKQINNILYSRHLCTNISYHFFYYKITFVN